ncbi:hypothetical protein FRC04_010783, partial [Tulasnella sp. 424]
RPPTSTLTSERHTPTPKPASGTFAYTDSSLHPTATLRPPNPPIPPRSTLGKLIPGVERTPTSTLSPFTCRRRKWQTPPLSTSMKLVYTFGPLPLPFSPDLHWAMPKVANATLMDFGKAAIQSYHRSPRPYTSTSTSKPAAAILIDVGEVDITSFATADPNSPTPKGANATLIPVGEASIHA